MGILNFLFGKSGSNLDGSSPQKAIRVADVGEEYRWVQRHCPGFRPVMQALHQLGGAPYDVLTLENDRGEKRTVYFDISSFFGKS